MTGMGFEPTILRLSVRSFRHSVFRAQEKLSSLIGKLARSTIELSGLDMSTIQFKHYK